MREGGGGNILEREQNITLISSLVKYDTPYLISSTSKNKKTLEDLKESEEQSNTYLRNIINKDDHSDHPYLFF